MTVMQNGLMGETGLRRTMPHWPQPGLIPRDPARGDRLETIAYFGNDQYEPQFVKTGAFQDALRQRGVRFVNRFQGEWHDYQHVDAVLAIRDCPPVVLATKPASKLINAWKERTRSTWPGTGLQGIAYLPAGFSGSSLGRGRAGLH